jgi:hypothetical protein
MPSHNEMAKWRREMRRHEEKYNGVRLDSLSIGTRFTVADGYLAPGGSSDAGTLTVSGARTEPGRIATTDGRALIGSTLVHPE